MNFEAVDHIHVNVSDRDLAKLWYADVLGLEPVKELAFWASDGGPLMIKNTAGTVQLALFENPKAQDSTIAFRVSAEGLQLALKKLNRCGVEHRLEDHEASWSIYFKDPDSNPYEITTYEYRRFKKLSL